MPRAPRPDDLFRLRIASEPRLSADGRLVALTLQTVAPGFDGYRDALWLVATDGSSPPRQVTLGARHDRHPRFSPDGRTLAFISDRRDLLDEPVTRPRTGHPGSSSGGASQPDREDRNQVFALPLDGGEARQVTDLPRGVTAFEWSPDGTRLVVVSSSHGATRAEDDRRRGIDRKPDPTAPPHSDYRYIDRLGSRLNGRGFIYDQVAHLWLVEFDGEGPAGSPARPAADRPATRLTDGRASDGEPAWSPDGRSIAFTSNRHRDADIHSHLQDIHVVDVETRVVTAITSGPRSAFTAPTWLPDGSAIAALGHRLPGGAGSRNDIWLLSPDGSDATPSGGRNLSAQHDLMPGSSMNSDVTHGEGTALIPSGHGRWLTFSAPVDGAIELWRIGVADGRLERLTEGRHHVSGWHAVPAPAGRGGTRIAYLRSSPTEPPDLWLLDTGSAAKTGPRRLTQFNAAVLADIDLREPVERHATVDGRDIQGWFLPAGDGPQPLVVEIHGGPHTLYGWALDVGIPGPGRCRHRGLLLQPAWLRGLWRGVQRCQPA